MKFVITPDARGRWSWELRNAQGLAISRSTSSYGDRAEAEAAIQGLRHSVASARLLGPTGATLDDFVATHAPKEGASK